MPNEKTILIIEDDASLRELAAKKLQKDGYTVVIAPDGNTALTELEKKLPDVILLDIILPGVDGFEILRELKADPKTKNIPVLLLSNLGQEEDINRGKRLGAADYIIKAHHTLDEIIEKIKSVTR